MRWRTAVVIAAAATSLLVASLLLYRLVYQGVPLIDEWYCSKGEAPVDFEGGGGACFPEGGALPAGAAWDPLGNRPLSCDGRRGWTVIHRGLAEDCLRDGEELPEGWSK
jgi:hypothetical protein